MQSLGGSSPAVVGGTEGFTTGGVITPAPQNGGRKRRGASVKTLKKMLKKAGLKTSGKKAALTRRAKKAHLKMGGALGVERTEEEMEALPANSAEGMLGKKPEFENADGGRRRSRRRNGLVKGVYRGVTGVAKGTLRSVGKVGKAVFGRGRKGKKY
jgi:hypothetical protein